MVARGMTLEEILLWAVVSAARPNASDRPATVYLYREVVVVDHLYRLSLGRYEAGACLAISDVPSDLH